MVNRDPTAEKHSYGATLEHMLPEVKGGNNTIFNLALTHGNCNSSRNERILPFKVTHPYLGQGPVSRGIVDSVKLNRFYEKAFR